MSELIQKYDSLKQATELAVVETDFQHIAEEILNQVVLETMKGYQARVNIGVQDSVSDLLDTFKRKISAAIFETAAGWKIPSRKLVLFPRGCRFCYQKGTSTILVIEHEPQIRTLCFDRSILNVARTHDSGSERVALAIPYAIFIAHFVHDEFKNLYTGWTQRSLSNLEDMIYPPFLPNVQTTLNVCLGKNVMHELRSISGIEAKIDRVIASFWGSQFNNDLSEFWWQKERFDSRLATVRSWARSSETDPLFILLVRLNENKKRSIQSLLDLLTTFEEEKDENAMRHALAEEVDKCVQGLFAKIMRYFKNNKFEKHYPKDATAVVQEVVKSVSFELSDVIFALDNEIRKLGLEIKQNKDIPVVPRGPLWSEGN